MRKYFVLLIAIFAVMIFGGVYKTHAATETKVLTPIADAWIDYANPGTPHPNGNFSVINAYSPDRTANSLVKFNMTSIPIGSIIDSASLGLFIDACEPTGNGPVLTTSRLISNWSESTATWNTNLHVTTAGKASSNTTVCARENSAVFNVKDIVQAWTSGSSNYGFLISSDSTMIFSQSFFSRDNQYDLPYLNITYSSPSEQTTTPDGGTTGGTTGTSSSSTGNSANTSSGSSPSGVAVNGASPDGSAATSATNETSVGNLSAEKASDQPTTILDIIKNPTKIFTSDWPWWKKALAIWAMMVILIAVGGGIFLIIKKIRKNKKK